MIRNWNDARRETMLCGTLPAAACAIALSMVAAASGQAPHFSSAAPANPTTSVAGAPLNQAPPMNAPILGAPAINPPDATQASYAAPAAPAPLPAQPQAVPLSPPDAKPSAKLPLRGAEKPAGVESRGTGWAAMFFSLAFVLGLFVISVRLLRRGMPQGPRVLPKEAVETLGRLPLPGRHQGQLLRVGNKVILVSFSNSGADVLAEIDDPAEVDRLAGLCAQADPHSATQSFRGVVEQYFREKPRQTAITRLNAKTDHAEVDHV